MSLWRRNVFDYWSKLKEKSDKYAESYADAPLKGAMRMAWWSLTGVFRVLYEDIRSKAVRRADSEAVNIAFVLGGGIGDVVMSALYVSRFLEKMDCSCRPTLFVKQSVASIASLLHGHSFSEDIRPLEKLVAEEFDLVLWLDVQYPVVGAVRMDRLRSLSAFLPEYVELLQNFRRKWGTVASKGGETFRQQYKCLIDGTTRITAMDVGGVLGLRHDDELKLSIPAGGEGALRKFGLEGVPFATLQRGVDAKRSSAESMRVWSVEKYEELVRRFKQRWPHIKLVQVGVSHERCRSIAGVDLDLIGQTSFAELMALESAAALHIDAECGIVHLRHFLCRKPSVVLFGPTSPKTKGYAENINIRASVCDCELCEWLIGHTWQSECVRNGTDVADCMEAITPDMVMQRLEEAEHLFSA